MNYAIATGHARTTEAAELILRSGGNVWDAAIAAHWTMCISEPCMASLGGAGIALLSTENGQVEQLDFFCQTPKLVNKEADELVDILVDFGSTQEHYFVGHASIAVPGTVAGLFAIHDRYGSIPMTELVQPAIDACKNGVTLNNFQQYDLRLLKEIQKLDPYLIDQFLDLDLNVLASGQITKNEKLADTFDFISREGPRSFYEGEVAQLFFKNHIGNGHCSPVDFKEYKVGWSTPQRLAVGEDIFYLPSRPSLGGYLLSKYLGIFKTAQGNTADRWAASFLNMRSIRADLWTYVDALDQNKSYNPFTRGTSHFSIMDEKGNAIALTSTIGEGAGIVIPDTGIHLNNMLGEEALLPQGLHSWIPDQRLDSMTTPVIVQDKNHQTQIAIGSAGAKRIPFVTAQCIEHVINGMDMQVAINQPRIYDDGKVIQVEPGISLKPTESETNYWEDQNLFFGGIQGVQRMGNQLRAGADLRRLGDAKMISV